MEIHRRARLHARSAACALMLMASPALAAVVDGALDPEYGAPLHVQTTQTSLGDFSGGISQGAELDAAYAMVQGGTLWLLLTGSFNRQLTEFIWYPDPVHLFFDTRSGGQNPLAASNASPPDYVNIQGLAGLTFDPEFVPEYWFGVARHIGPFGDFVAYTAELPDAGGGAGNKLGHGNSGPPGALGGTGAVNPFGVLASLDYSNLAGVTAGCGPASGAGVTTGLEFAIPLAALGSPVGPIRVAIFLTDAVGNPPGVSNQFIPPLAPGTCALGPANAVNLATVPGPQYFVLDLATPAARTSWGRLRVLYR